MQATGGSLIPRMIGAAKLDSATYEEVENDQSATTQALIVVAIAAVAAAIGGIGDGGEGVIGGLLGSLIGWVITSALAFFVGTKLLAGPNTHADMGQVLRATGFAYTPTILSVVGFIPVLGPIVSLIGGVLALIAYVIALRAAFDVTTGRAIAIAIVAWIVGIIIAGIILAIFGLSFAAFG